ncbi:MAG: multiple monosaccharide ABC transporter ATP-binding protein [Actinophytocola sp.]|uniref:multiple monosaccharide ABC transporter ATP-binding protein n=1 Tax=Actinophytocola sp. TaxID=1872138 RepID=UPI003C793518
MSGITKSFPGVTALRDVAFSVRRGEIHAICGENGAGKSTLMKILSGVHPHGSYSGEVVFDGEACRFAGIRDSEARGVVIIHQELALVGQLSIAENLFLGNEIAHRGLIDWNRTNHEAERHLRRVGLHENPTTAAGELGVGKQQLVEIAKALSKEVRLLILDEPTAALNDDDSAHLLDLLRGLRDDGITCVVISHKLGEVTEIADTITILRDGRTIETLDATDVTEERIIAGMVGRDLEHRFPPRHRTTPRGRPESDGSLREQEIGDEVLRIEDWTVHSATNPDRVVVDHATLSLRRGEIVGLAGLMGAGRTELAMSVFGRSYGVDISGRVYKDGREIDVRTVRSAIRNGLAYVSEDRKRYGLNLVTDVKRNVSSAGLGLLSTRGWVDEHEEFRVAERFRGALRIKTPDVMAPARTLSGGNQQKVVLAKWMFTEPDVLILDEPTRGVDVGAKYEIYTIVNSLADQGKAVLVISSELPELLGLCDRIYTLSAGRITGEVPREEATQELLMEYMTQEERT